MNLSEKHCADPHRLLSTYRKEKKQISKIKPGDTVTFRRLFIFLPFL